MSLCIFKKRGSGCVCTKCGKSVRGHSGEGLISQCRLPSSGFGDRVASAIKVVARLLHIERWVKETPGCGCQKRKEALNKFGRSFWWTKSAK